MGEWFENSLEFIISIILGVLPSFLIFSIFNQSEFSFSRYGNFLVNFSSSWLSWISIIFVAGIIYFLLVKLQSKTKKVLVLIFAVFLLLAFIVAYLYAYYLLGNDVLVKLSADKENLFFESISSQKVTFTMSALMNPFCIAQCEYSIMDISTGEIAETGEFSVNSLISTSQEYTFTNEGHPYGQGIYRFEVGCKGQKTKLCYTDGSYSKRAMLITLNYEINKEQKAKNEISRKEIISEQEKVYNISQKLKELNLKIASLGNFIFIEGQLEQQTSISKELLILNTSFENTKQKWISQNYSEFEKEFPNIKNKTVNISAKEKELSSTIDSYISSYNNMVEALNNSRTRLKEISTKNISSFSCTNLNSTIEKFNETMGEFLQKSNISYKESKVNNIFEEIKGIYEVTNGESGGTACALTNTIREDVIPRIEIIISNYTLPEISLEDPTPICCFYGKCEKCCDESCSNKNYPLIFIHGHSINKDTSADYSLDGFRDVKEKLVGEGYIDAGAIIISKSSEQNGLWGKVNAPIEVTGSYFFDVSKSETGQETIVPSKTDNIDTYSLRLNDLIDTVKARTGKDKVIVVAHSMGGLVTRRYVQIFGDKKDIAKIILVAVPNHGIDGSIKNYCPLIGSNAECKDMNSDSILINKLTNAPNMSMPVYNIVTSGCNMDGEMGDGIVKTASQYLPYVINYQVNGTCNEKELQLLHSTVLNPKVHPEAYEFIKEILKKE